MKRPRIVCPKCRGNGIVPLPEALYETLELVAAKKSISAIEAHKLIGAGSTPTAMNGRLEDLRAFGMVERKRMGKTWIYSVRQNGK